MSYSISVPLTIAPMALLGPVPSILSIYSLLGKWMRRSVMATFPMVAIAAIELTVTEFTVRLAPMGFTSPLSGLLIATPHPSLTITTVLYST